jgi:Raf kinase inhibitor-like YbhB/YbcL family protein
MPIDYKKKYLKYKNKYMKLKQKAGADFTFTVHSGNGKFIDAKYTCDVNNPVNPRVTWSNAPADTKYFALIMDDPDAPNGTFDHWVVWDIPANVTEIPENHKNDAQLTTGRNSGGTIAYYGPCPPHGTHRYNFQFYSLSDKVGLSAGSTKQDLLNRIKEMEDAHTLVAKIQLTQSYGRPKSEE